MTEEKIQEEASRPTRARILADRARVRAKLRPFLDTIRRRLCDPSFNVAALWREHGVRDKSAAAYFHELGTTPSKYLREARMDVAAQILVATHYPLKRVAGLVGVSRRTLLRRFPERHGPTPEEYRRHHGDLPGEAADTEKLVQGIHGRLDRPDNAGPAGTVAEALDRLYAFFSEPLEPSAPAMLSGRDFEAFQVRERIWPELTGGKLPFEEERYRVLACRGLSTPAFYELLHQRSREEGRKDRRRGVQLAQLALDSLEANAETLGPHYPVLRPQAWAWLGNAYRLALDFPAADRAIDEAVRGLGRTRDPLATGIVHLCRGTLRTFQRRHDEAVEIFDVALPAFEEAGDASWQITTLVHRSAALDYAGRHDTALETLFRASARPGAEAEPFTFELPFSIALTLVKLGRFAEAQIYVATLNSAEGAEGASWRGLWMEAAVAQGFGRLEEAEKKYLATLRDLETLGESFYRTLLWLDLALLYAEQARTEDVIRICEAIGPIFGSLKMYEETLATVQLFARAMSEDCVTVDVLRNLRSSLRRDPLLEV